MRERKGEEEGQEVKGLAPHGNGCPSGARYTQPSQAVQVVGGFGEDAGGIAEAAEALNTRENRNRIMFISASQYLCGESLRFCRRESCGACPLLRVR